MSSRATAHDPPPGVHRTYFHGTSGLSAVCVVTQGFRLLDEGVRVWGRGYLGDGIYITRSRTMATEFADAASCKVEGAAPYLLQVTLRPGARIVRIGDAVDHRLVQSLRAEFGKDILTPRFPRSIPKNKHLKSRELIALLNFLWQKDAIDPFAAGEPASGFRSYLRRLGYQGFGQPESDIGIVVFNPSDVVLQRVFAAGRGSMPARAATHAELAEHAATECREREASTADWIDDLDVSPKERSAQWAEVDRWRRALEQFSANPESFADL